MIQKSIAGLWQPGFGTREHRRALWYYSRIDRVVRFFCSSTGSRLQFPADEMESHSLQEDG